MHKLFFFEAQSVFKLAIKVGHLSETPNAKNFVGSYMYMHSEHVENDRYTHFFKHIDTRLYSNLTLNRPKNLPLIHVSKD